MMQCLDRAACANSHHIKTLEIFSLMIRRVFLWDCIVTVYEEKNTKHKAKSLACLLHMKYQKCPSIDITYWDAFFLTQLNDQHINNIYMFTISKHQSFGQHKPICYRSCWPFTGIVIGNTASLTDLSNTHHQVFTQCSDQQTENHHTHGVGSVDGDVRSMSTPPHSMVIW